MSWCVREYCEIYRDKKYCTARQKKVIGGMCRCRHAKRRCQVGAFCSLDCGGAEALDKMDDALVELRDAVFGKTKEEE